MSSTFRVVSAASLILALTACSGGGGGGSGFSSVNDFSGDVASAWFDLQLDLVRTTPGFSPPVASRAFGYSGVALYEALVPGMDARESLSGQLNGLGAVPQPAPGMDLHWGAVANAALARITRRMFPNTSAGNVTSIDTLEASQEVAFGAEADAATLARSRDHGRAVAEFVANWSLNDGAAFGYLTNMSPGYVAPVGPGLWEPTPPANAPALQAYWGENRPFVLASGASGHPGNPPAYSTDPASTFYQEALEVYQTVNNATAEQTAIAQFWSDDPGATATPPGHWISILNQISARDTLPLDQRAEAYCRLGLAVADAFIACWYSKFEVNLLRPITFIRANIDAGWSPLLNTPPFPEFTSGHSVQSGAAATVLTELFGENFAFTDDTHATLSYPARSFTSFLDAAQEAADSRLYGGIHYRAAIDLGVEQGFTVGRAVNALRWRDGVALAAGNRTESYPDDVARAWFDLSLGIVRTTPGFSPPVASRAFGYAGVTLYETVVPGMRDHQSLAGQLNGLTPLPKVSDGAEYHWPLAANAALARIFRRLFPTTPMTNMAAIDALEQSQLAGLSVGIANEVRDRSVARGVAIADAVFYWSRSDGGHEGYTRNFPASYVPPVFPGAWVPTPTGFQSALQPFWGQNRPFALGDSAECLPGPPPPYSTSATSEFFAQALEVYETATMLTPEQAAIAMWWSDDPGTTATPPGHSISMLGIVLDDENADLAAAAEGYAKVGMAVADGFVSCWHAKYVYNLLRPVTYVRANIDPAWTPLLSTPPFPEYTSGHSVQSGAWAEVMTDLYGGNVAFVDTTNTVLGQPARSFGSFYQAADEAAISRLYGGIHFRAAIDIGVQQGRCVGQAVNALAFRKD